LTTCRPVRRIKIADNARQDAPTSHVASLRYVVAAGTILAQAERTSQARSHRE
jgi:hypothetical protein